MNEQPSPGFRMDDDAPGSPKRKKVRAKYAPKACVACRRSKLKCSGENPCQRCLDNGRRCFYSEDQTAAEALQNLSRPPPNQSSNGNGTLRRSILPRSGDVVERRASDASVLGMGVSMEARMARIENMMEALVQDRGIGITPRGSIERDGSGSDGFQTDTAYQTPMDAFGANLVPVRQHDFMQDSPESRRRNSIGSPPSSEPSPTIRFGSRNLLFPSPFNYQKYVDYFFSDVNPCHPCVNEAEFRSRSEQMLVSRHIHASEVSFLALNYMIFACVDVLVDTTPVGMGSKLPGWQWYQLADELIGKRKLSGRADVTLVQSLIWEAIYLVSADRPNAAYNVISLACRICFQLGLHQQIRWSNCTPFETHMRQRIFWTLYFNERHISMSCGRPYNIRDLDVDVDQPSWIYDGDLIHPEQALPEIHISKSSNIFLASMISWGKFVGDVWDQVLSTSASRQGIDTENAIILDARIKHWTENVLPTFPLLPPDRGPEVRHLRQRTVSITRFNNLRLLLRKKTMLSLKFDGNTGRLCGDLAIDTIERVKAHAPEAKIPSSFRHQMTASLAGAILILSTLLVRDLPSLGLQDKGATYAESFRDAVGVLQDLAMYLQVARRVADDFKDVIHVVTAILNGGPPDLMPATFDHLFPYQVLDFAEQQGSASDTSTWTGGENDSWDVEIQPSSGICGVPWM